MVTDAERGLSVRTTATAGELLEAWFDRAVALERLCDQIIEHCVQLDPDTIEAARPLVLTSASGPAQ